MSRLAALRDRLPTPFGYVVLAALALIPLIYSSSLIGANEDPTGHLDAVPAAIVDADTPVTITAPDGSTQRLALGEEISADLVGSAETNNFSWTAASAAEAAAGLADGTYYAVLDVPDDFSARVASALIVDADAAADAQRATLTIRTDDAANYITGNIAKTLGTALVDTVGSSVRQEYLAEVYLGFTAIHDSLDDAAAGAGELAAGLTELADGAAALPSGLAQLSAGSSTATDGAAALNSGLTTLASGASGLSGGLDQLLAAYPTLDDTQRLALLTRLDAAAHSVADGTSSAVAGSATLEAGLSSLSSGLADAATSAPALVDGLTAARDGAGTLTDELGNGAAEVPAFDEAQAEQLSTITGTPIELVAVRDHAVAGYGAGLTPYFLALGLWIGAVGTFLMRPALSARLLERRRPAVLVALGSYLPNAIIAVVQALLATLIVDAVLPIEAADLPALTGLAVLASLTFMAIVQALIAVLGPTGRFLALVLTVLQVSSAGGTYPVQTAPGFFQALHGVLPLSHAMQGFRALVSGGELGLATAVPVLAAWLLGALAVTTFAALRAGRQARRIGARAVVLAEDEPAIA